MGNAGTNIIATIIVLGFLVFAHESGHFFTAKLFRVRVLVFSLGFGKRLFGFRRNGTDYRVSLVPLGGYVRMAGDTPEENVPANPDEFLSKPKWQRFLILLAGPLMNLLIAVAFTTVINMNPVEMRNDPPIIGEVTPGKAADLAGLKPRDRIVSVNGEAINDYDDLKMAITLNAGTTMPVVFIRDGQQRTTKITPQKVSTEYGSIGRASILPWIEPVVGHVDPTSLAAKAGLQAGDRILSANGHPVEHFLQFTTVADAAKGAPISLMVARGTAHLPLTLPGVPKVDEQDPYRGVGPPTIVRKLPFFPAIRQSVQDNIKLLHYTVSALGRLFRPEGSVKELSGPISIARISGESLRLGFLPLLRLMAMISLQLGFMNLLPIPVLDGGHIFVLLIEGAARRDLSLRVKERVQQLGFAVLAALMVVVMYNDVILNFLTVHKG